MRRLSLLVFVLALPLACSREAEVPADTTAPMPSTTTAPAASSATVAPVNDTATYDAAMKWLKANPGFRFTLKDRGVTAEGEMKRPRVGSEQVTFKAEGAEWRGEAGVKGVVWSTREGGKWKEATPPEYAGRIYQRVTFAFDPQKKEGAPQLVVADPASNLYRFTDANTGLVHEVRVNRSDAHIESMNIGSDVELTVLP